MRDIEDKSLLLVVAVMSLMMGWLLWPYWAAAMWGLVLAIVFMPVQVRFRRLTHDSPNVAALMTLLTVLLLVMLPLVLVLAQLLRQARALYAAYQSGDVQLEEIVPKLMEYIPHWVRELLERFDLPSPETLFGQMIGALKGSVQFLAGQALNFGQIGLVFVVSLALMLYLLYFLLADGPRLQRAVQRAIPMKPVHRDALIAQFTVAIRATVQGTVIVAVTQGALGGLIFWILGLRAPVLWGALMAVLSLLPVVGSGLVWVPAAIYLMVTGSLVKGIVLIAYGILAIGLVDNLLRPMVVGKQTRLPDWIVLFTTLGGLDLFGTNGILIGPVVATLFIAAWKALTTERESQSVHLMQTGPAPDEVSLAQQALADRRTGRTPARAGGE